MSIVRRWARPAWVLVRILLVPTWILLVVRLLDPRALTFLGSGPIWWFVAMACVTGVAMALAGARLSMSLRLLGIKLPSSAGIKTHFQAMFYFVFVPLAVGVDVAKFQKIRAALPGTSASRLTVALAVDRMFGVVSMVLVAGALLPFTDLIDHSWLDFPPTAVGIVVVSGLVIAPFLVRAIIRIFGAIVRALPTISEVQPVGTVVKRSFVALMLSIGSLVGLAASVYGAAAYSGIDIAYLSVLFVFSASMILQVVPVALGGIGATEAGGLVLYRVMGAGGTEALVLVTLSVLFRALVSLVGGIWDIAEVLRLDQIRQRWRTSKLNSNEESQL